jgi:hypothetical protein
MIFSSGGIGARERSASRRVSEHALGEKMYHTSALFESVPQEGGVKKRSQSAENETNRKSTKIMKRFDELSEVRVCV